MTSDASSRAARARLLALFDELLRHDGYGSLRVDVRILRRGQKEVIVDCGKQYRFVVDVPADADTVEPAVAHARALTPGP